MLAALNEKAKWYCWPKSYIFSIRGSERFPHEFESVSDCLHTSSWEELIIDMGTIAKSLPNMAVDGWLSYQKIKKRRQDDKQHEASWNFNLNRDCLDENQQLFGLCHFPRKVTIGVWKKVGTGPGQKVLTWVGSGQSSLVWVWLWKISPKNLKFYNFFASKMGWPLVYCGSKVCSDRIGPGRVRAHL